MELDNPEAYERMKEKNRVRMRVAREQSKMEKEHHSNDKQPLNTTVMKGESSSSHSESSPNSSYFSTRQSLH